MKEIKKISLMLAMSSVLLFNVGSVFAADDLPSKSTVDTPKKDEQTANDKVAKEEEQRARALSKRPDKVGEEELNREAEGFSKLSKEALENWSKGRMLPTPYNPADDKGQPLKTQ